MELNPGTRLGRYEIQNLLGTGGMGEVYRALDTELRRPVALKFLRPEVAADEKRMQRFIQEARAASALNHPNILTVYEIGQADGARFFSTELVDSNLWTQPVEGGAPKQLTKFTTERIDNFAPSRDGKQFAISRGTSSADIILIKDFR